MHKISFFILFFVAILSAAFFTTAPNGFCQAKPDLSVRIKCPGSAIAGQDLGASIIIELSNTTNVQAITVGIDIVLSKDAVIPLKAAVYQPNWSEDVLLKGGREFVEKIGGMSTITVPLKGANTIPADTPTGSYYIGVFVDSTNNNSETNERNNTAICPINITGKEAQNPPEDLDQSQKPDLAVGKIWITPLRLFAGSKAALHCSFQNNGAELKGTWKISYLIDGIEIYTQNFGDIAAGAFQDPSAPWTATNPGIHKFGCILDQGNNIQESSERNNKAIMEFRVHPRGSVPPPKPN
jgi:hypothetical protein